MTDDLEGLRTKIEALRRGNPVFQTDRIYNVALERVLSLFPPKPPKYEVTDITSDWLIRRSGAMAYACIPKHWPDAERLAGELCDKLNEAET